MSGLPTVFPGKTIHDVIAPGKLGKGGREVEYNSETFQWNPAGQQSRPAKPGPQPEASLASPGSNPCRLHRHQPVAAQHQTLVQKLRGHFAYYGITGNGQSLQRFREAVVRIWRKWLARRRRRGFLSWETYTRVLKRYALPAAVVVHSVYRRVSEPVT